MTKIDITKTELVWPGKYNEDGTRREVPRISLPFQVIERVNESRATREAKKEHSLSLFDIYEAQEGKTFEDGWRNKLIWGDNRPVIGSLLEKFAGKVDLCYLDPPFQTGADFSVTTELPDSEEPVFKAASAIEQKAYRDTWGRGIDSYIQWFADVMVLVRELLSERATLYVHLDWHVCNPAKVVMDEIFGADNFVNEIIWQKIRTTKAQTLGYGNVHDNLFVYRKGQGTVFHKQRKDLDPKYIASHYKPDPKTGKLYRTVSLLQKGKGPARQFADRTLAPPAGMHWIWSQERIEKAMSLGLIRFTSNGRPEKIQFLDDMDGDIVDDIWDDIYPINSQAVEALGYPTQKPEALLERIILASSNSGDLVADFFCGSGTTAATAEKHGRRWITCDLGRFAVHTARKRLLSIPNCKPFEILNLGKYERQYWQGITFGSGKNTIEQALYEYLAFVLRLYRSQPVTGMAYLHGKKGGAMVHIGAVDAPVTIDEINLALTECIQVKQKELHVLGWEWEMGLYELVPAEAKKKGVKLVLLQIPNEAMEQQAIDKGDIQFFELAYLRVGVEQPRPLVATVTLKDFVISNTEMIPDEVRARVKNWVDFVDYWAVDWDFQNDTFMQKWSSYRTRQNRDLVLTSDPHTYKEAGTYRVLVKVIDIFGNDTSQVFSVEVKA